MHHPKLTKRPWQEQNLKITDAIDPNIVKKLNEIRINIQTTSSEYANFTKQLSEGIKF